MKFIAATAITTLALIGFGTIATAAWASEPVPLSDGTCWQPGTNPPVHVDCNGPLATTPATTIAFVEPPATTTPTTQPDGTWGTPSNPFPDGSCAQPGSNPPVHVDCTGTFVTTPYVPEHSYVPPTTTAAPSVAGTAVSAPSVEPDPAPIALAQTHRSAPRQLPSTGSPSAILLAIAAALLAGGTLLLAARRLAL